MSYEGILEGIREGDGHAGNDSGSLLTPKPLQRCPNGVDTDQNDDDFGPFGGMSPGKANARGAP